MGRYKVSGWNRVKLDDLKNPSDRKSIPSSPGVYVIFYQTRAKRIRRLGSEDREQIFYIGQTKNVRKRLYDLYKDIALLEKGSNNWGRVPILSKFI